MKTISKVDLDLMFRYLKHSINDFQSSNSFNENLQIYFPNWLIRCIDYSIPGILDQRHLNSDLPKQIFGVNVVTGYDQNKIIVSNCASGYGMFRVENFIIQIENKKNDQAYFCPPIRDLVNNEF